MPCATLELVEVTEHDIARIPVRNLRVPRDEFGALRVEAQRLSRERAERGVTDWYLGGVVTTCQWLAGTIVRTSNGQRFPAYSPASGKTATAYEELIEAEYLAAELLDVRQPRPATSRPGWCEGVRATLRWAWRRNGPSPIDVAVSAQPSDMRSVG
ncbi:MAG: hypothetical protein ACRDRK_16660 [Pseudonocardia sp.]